MQLRQLGQGTYSFYFNNASSYDASIDQTISGEMASQISLAVPEIKWRNVLQNVQAVWEKLKKSQMSVY